MNQAREDLKSHEADIKPAIDADALRHAHSVADLIRDAPAMPFYRAYDQAAVAFAGEHRITESGAKEMMKAAFAASEGRELYQAGKEAEGLHHKSARKEPEDFEKKSESRSRRQKSWSRS